MNDSNQPELPGNHADDLADRAGAVASTLCAIHCAISALLPVVFTMLGLGFLLNHAAEWVLTAIAAAFAAIALALAVRNNRPSYIPALLALGIVGLLASRVLEASEGDHDGPHSEHASAAAAQNTHAHAGLAWGTAVGVLAGFALLTGHMLNLRARRQLNKM